MNTHLKVSVLSPKLKELTASKNKNKIGIA